MVACPLQQEPPGRLPFPAPRGGAQARASASSAALDPSTSAAATSVHTQRPCTIPCAQSPAEATLCNAPALGATTLPAWAAPLKSCLGWWRWCIAWAPDGFNPPLPLARRGEAIAKNKPIPQLVDHVRVQGQVQSLLDRCTSRSAGAGSAPPSRRRRGPPPSPPPSPPVLGAGSLLECKVLSVWLLCSASNMRNSSTKAITRAALCQQHSVGHKLTTLFDA